ncbi:MAG: class I SAM-dependent methyltransferase [Gemmatimonadales bacterium]
MTSTSYTGLSAASYDLWFASEGFEDVEFFRDAIRSGGEPALEVACGTGRLLVPFAREGLGVEGLDLSEEMLRICRRKAQAAGVQPTLHRAAMEDFDLDRRFRTIFVPFGSFMLLDDLDKARRALGCFRAHLEEGGCALIPLHLPWLHDVGVEPALPGEWRLRRVATRPEDYAVVRCFENTSFDFDRQVQDVRLRFEVVLAGEVIEQEESEQRLRWYTQKEFAHLLEDAGFRDREVLEAYTWKPAERDSASFMFIAR